jgi:hypothetical protein
MRRAVLTAACFCTFFLCRDITRSLRAPAKEREEFVVAIDAVNGDDNAVVFSTAGWNSDALVVTINADQVERDAIAAEILHGRDDVRDVNFREFLKMLGFSQIQIEGHAPQSFDVSAPSSIQTGGGEDGTEWVIEQSHYTKGETCSTRIN